MRLMRIIFGGMLLAVGFSFMFRYPSGARYSR